MDTPDDDDRAVGADDEAERLRRALDEQREQYLRLLADFDNFRRRAAREHDVAGREGRRAALLPLLALLDTLERALAAGSTGRNFYDGVAPTHRLFVNAPRQARARPRGGVGRPVGPDPHRA